MHGDESYTMQPVDYELSFSVQDNIPLCTFETEHFCSYCLHRGCNHPMVNRISALYLKPAKFIHLKRFTVEVWFTFSTGYCLMRSKELHAKKGMLL